jgi:hypothetical protein
MRRTQPEGILGMARRQRRDGRRTTGQGARPSTGRDRILAGGMTQAPVGDRPIAAGHGRSIASSSSELVTGRRQLKPRQT